MAVDDGVGVVRAVQARMYRYAVGGLQREIADGVGGPGRCGTSHCRNGKRDDGCERGEGKKRKSHAGIIPRSQNRHNAGGRSIHTRENELTG
jgi:hypothetical protein